MDSEADRLELNEKVALSLGWLHLGDMGRNAPWCASGGQDWWKSPEGEFICGECFGLPYDYSGDWSVGGPMIEEHCIEISLNKGGGWMAVEYAGGGTGEGETPLIAACEAKISAKGE